jgi:hypothetical protein
MIKTAFALFAFLYTSGCDTPKASRHPIHVASASTTPLAMKSGSFFRNSLSSFAAAHDLELTVTQEIVFSEGADANIQLSERRSGCGQFDIVVIGAASLSHRARILMYASRDPNCRGAYDLDVIWNSFLSAMETNPDLENVEEGGGQLGATPAPGLQEKSP